MSIVSNNIKYLRRLNGLTQEQFARKIGIKRSLLGAYEESRANPNLDNLKNMAAAFGVSVDNMLKNDLRRIKETPHLGMVANPAKPAPASPLMADTPASQSPKPIAEILDSYQAPQSPLRMVSRPVALKNVYNNPLAPPIKEPVYQASSTQQPTSYPSIEKEEILPEPHHLSQQEATFNVDFQGDIRVVSKTSADAYLQNTKSDALIKSLSTLRIPNLPEGNYRAFEGGEDFPLPGSLLVGSFLTNTDEIKDGNHYILIHPLRGILYRRIYNQVKTKGLLLLTSDLFNIGSQEIPVREFVEIWEVRAFVGYQTPPVPPSTDRLKKLVGELQQELDGYRSF